MRNSLYDTAILFFAYSFLAWIAETTIATIKNKTFRNRGFACGPFCFIYGFTAVLLSVTLFELRQSPFFLFLGSAVISTAVEWFTGKTLERIKQKKWWDYSNKKWNFDGYICLQYSLLWGALGLLVIYFGNGLILSLYHLLPLLLEKAAVWALLIIGFIDLSGSFLLLNYMEEKFPCLPGWNHRLRSFTYRFGTKIAASIERRIGRAYPSVTKDKAAEQDKAEERCSLIQLFWLFFIGSLLGDIVETIFCRLTTGVWMSRSSLVWGPFSIVWGLGIALATALLYRDRDKPDSHIFWTGTLLGGAYEYICSVFTEIVFGTVFWDYSEIPFNLGGRINLLYCFFWGIAAVVWIKGLYPKTSGLIDLIREKAGLLLTPALILFMAVNMSVSVLALIRYDSRTNGHIAESRWEQIMDIRFDDERMDRIYPNAIPQ